MSTPLTPKRRRPVAIVPTDIISSQDNPAIIMGYYVENTQYYNLLPPTDTLDPKRLTSIGIIYDSQKIKESGLYECFQGKEWESFEIPASQDLPLTLPILIGCYFDDGLRLIEVSGNSRSTFNQEPQNESTDSSIPDGTNINTLIATTVKTEYYSLKLDLFSRNTGILESDIMLHKRALLIGCGSVGSLVAVELAKSGVGHFMLVDNDIFGYHNICRHQCGIYDVGRYKVDVVAERILQINPYAEVIKCPQPIQWVDTAMIQEFCNHDCVIVGGADNREGDLYACNLGLPGGASFVSIGCWERAFAGEIFYCLPEGMPTYKDLLEVTGYVSGRVTQNRRFYTSEEELEKANFEPGISADINFVTIIGVKLILDLLNRDNETFTQRLLPHLTQYTLVCNTNNPKIGGEMAKIFSYPLQVTTSIVVPYADGADD